MPDDRHDDWFEPDPEPRPRPEPVRRARTERTPPPAARRPALVAGIAVLALLVLVGIIIASAVGGDDGEAEQVPAPVTGEVAPEPAPETTPLETETAAEPPPVEPEVPAGETLRLGDEGEGVRALQEALAELGFEIGQPDGVFGEQTRQAVRAFQEQQGLSADGVAGPETLEAIRNALAQREG